MQGRRQIDKSRMQQNEDEGLSDGLSFLEQKKVRSVESSGSKR